MPSIGRVLQAVTGKQGELMVAGISWAVSGAALDAPRSHIGTSADAD